MYKSRTVFVVAAAAVLIVVTAALPVLAPPSGAASIVPPKSLVYGKSLAGWLEGYWRWYYTGGASATTPYQPETAPIVYMPLPQGEYTGGSWTPEDPVILQGSLEVDLPKGTAFVLPMFAWIAERYNTGQLDDPSIPNDRIQGVITGVDGTGVPSVTLDGKPILQNFWDYYVGPLPFNPVVEYPEPSSYGSIAAIAFQSTGFISAPLTPGTHTIKLLERLTVTNDDLPGYEFPYSLGLVYDNTWIISVK